MSQETDELLVQVEKLGKELELLAKGLTPLHRILAQSILARLVAILVAIVQQLERGRNASG